MAEPYYHSLSRKYIILFGSLFSDLYIERQDAEDVVKKTLKVPISYGPKEWYLARLYENPELTKQINQIVPRITFDFVGFRYASDRKLNNTNQTTQGNSYAGTLSTVNSPVPYDIMVRMSILVRNADDGTRIIEQILPRFTPELTHKVMLVPEMNISQDIQINLMNVQYDDKYEGSLREEDRVIVWNLDFLIKAYFFGNVSRSKVIKNINVNIFDNLPPDAQDQPALTIGITPGLTANGEPTTDPDLSVSYDQIQKEDNWDFIVQFMSPGNATIVRPPDYQFGGFDFSNPLNSAFAVLI